MLRKNRDALTELQEKSLLKAASTGGWIAFWGLLIAIIVQMLMDNYVLQNILGETVVFLVLDAQILMSCLKNGVWGKRLMSNLKTNIILSFICATIIGLVVFFVEIRMTPDKFSALTNAGVIFAIIFAAMTVILSISAIFRLRKIKKIENEEALEEAKIEAENELADREENAGVEIINTQEEVPGENTEEKSFEYPAEGETAENSEPETSEPETPEIEKKPENSFQKAFSKFFMKDDSKNKAEESDNIENKTNQM